MPYLQNAIGFTIDTLVGLYLIAVILRFLFQLFRVDFHNPISQSIFTLTNPPLTFFRRFIPGLFGIDLAAVILVFLISMLNVTLLSLVLGGRLNIQGIVLLGIGEALNTTIWILLIAIIAGAILSWFRSGGKYHPVMSIIDGLSAPVLRPFQRLLPSMQGIDLSPIIAIVALNVVQSLVAYPLIDIGRRLL